MRLIAVKIPKIPPKNVTLYIPQIVIIISTSQNFGRVGSGNGRVGIGILDFTKIIGLIMVLVGLRMGLKMGVSPATQLKTRVLN